MSGINNFGQKYYSRAVLKEEKFESSQPVLKLYADKVPLFVSYFLESQSEKALDEHVWLKSGGFLVIEETEAFESVAEI